MQTNAYGHVLAHEFGQGDAVGQARANEYGAVPVAGSSAEILPGTRGCLIFKTDGQPCKAPPETGTDMCVGHRRVQEKLKEGS